MSEKFSLKWNDFQSNVTSAFSILRTNFQDVTLVSEDHKQMSAHRVVWTACSRHLNDVLSQNSHQLLCLDGINFSELNNVLDYIHIGELQIDQEDLERFLQTAQKLQLQDLLRSEDHEQKEQIKELTSFESEMTGSDNLNMTVKTVQTGEKQIISMFADDFQTLRTLMHLQQIIQTEKGHTCNFCNKISTKRASIKEHIEFHINGLLFNCDCENTYSSRLNLRKHKGKHCNKKLK